MAERSYGRLSTLLNHKFIERKPIILYASHSDFQQTNALGGDIGEATGGVTDFMKHRAIMPFTGSYKDFDHVLMHEMVHQFQYDTWSRGKAGAGRRHDHPGEPPALVRGRDGGVPLAGANHARDGHVAARRRPPGQAAHHPAADLRPLHLPLPLRPLDLGLHREPLGRRGGRRHPVRHAGRRRRRGGVPAGPRHHAQPAVRPVARLGAGDLPAGRRVEAAGVRGRQADSHQGALGRHAAYRAGALARREADRLPERAELLLHRLLPGRRRDRRGHHEAREVGVRRQLRDLPVHQLHLLVVAGQQVPHLRGPGQGRRRPRHLRPEAAQGGPPHPGEPERPGVAGRSAPTASSWRSPGWKAASRTCT